MMTEFTFAAVSGAKLWERYMKGQLKNLLRLAILLACSVVVIIQLSECFYKLISPPISTNTRISLNKTMTYPALTICRSPPYKADVVKKYNLGSDIRWTSEWVNFPFENVTLQEFWDEATYTQKEVLSLAALNYRPDYVNITKSTYFLSGKCHTLVPQTETTGAGRAVGFSVLLKHSKSEVANPPLLDELGWNIYIHDAREPWTESRMQTSGRQEGLFLEVGEQLHVKIGVQDFRLLSDSRGQCNSDPSYNITRCEDLCHWNHLVRNVGCGAPWLIGVNATHCNSYDSMKNLIVGYLNTECSTSCCGCISSCRVQQFTTYIVNRKPMSGVYSQLFVFYSSKLVTMIEEHVSYDWSLFIADMGGSLGFILGISVLGIIDVIERLVNVYFRRPSEEQNNDAASNETGVSVAVIPHKF